MATADIRPVPVAPEWVQRSKAAMWLWETDLGWRVRAADADTPLLQESLLRDAQIRWETVHPGEVLKAHRIMLGLTQEQLAEQLDTTHATISRWESGARVIEHRRMLFLALSELHRQLGLGEPPYLWRESDGNE